MREATNRILELVEEGMLDRDTVIMACLKYMDTERILRENTSCVSLTFLRSLYGEVGFCSRLSQLPSFKRGKGKED